MASKPTNNGKVTYLRPVTRLPLPEPAQPPRTRRHSDYVSWRRLCCFVTVIVMAFVWGLRS
jgi:hypothetical protein